jgi:hypothetical protein
MIGPNGNDISFDRLTFELLFELLFELAVGYTIIYENREVYAVNLIYQKYDNCLAFCIGVSLVLTRFNRYMVGIENGIYLH